MRACGHIDRETTAREFIKIQEMELADALKPRLQHKNDAIEYAQRFNKKFPIRPSDTVPLNNYKEGVGWEKHNPRFEQQFEKYAQKMDREPNVIGRQFLAERRI